MICVFFNKSCLSPELLAEELWSISQDAYEFGSPWKRHEFESDILNPQSEYLIIKEKGEILGFLGYHWVLDEAEITNIVVRKSHQHRGIGGVLLQQMLESLGEAGIKQVFLEVRKSNSAAQKLYIKAKFHPVGVRKAYYRNPDEDGIIMCGKVRIENVKNFKKFNSGN